MEDWQDHNQEFLRITPSLVDVVPEAAALVVYGNASMQGETVSLTTDQYSSPQVELKYGVLFGNISPRQVKGRTYYVAIFPRVYFFTCDGKKADVTHASCGLTGLPRLGTQSILDKLEAVTLYPGLVTEVDWSREDYKGLFGDRKL
jgi:hypothetical protein